MKNCKREVERPEQRAFARHSLNYVIDACLPKKLSNPKKFLP